MVLKKSICYGGFHGLLPPVIPKAPRSLRKWSLRKKSPKDGEICAFDLLASVADKLLQEHESESSTSSTGSKGKQEISFPEESVKIEQLEVKVKPVVSGHHDLASGTESELVAQPTNIDPRFPHSENDSSSDHASIVSNAGLNKKVNTNLIMEAIEEKPGNLEKQSIELTSVKTCSLEVRLEPSVNTRVTNKSSSSVHLSFCKDTFNRDCFPRHRGNVNINIRDDDEKYFRYKNRSITRLRAFRSRSRAGYKRMRKLMPSRYWKVARKSKDCELPNSASGGIKSFYHKRKIINARERFQSDVSKRRKLFNQTSRIPYVKKTTSESISNLVKFSIKSFKVPDLYIEVPETATIGSLKSNVMEAVMAILHGKLHVGVLVQGKKVRDDDRTLQQSGISKNCNHETLRFTLEPSLPEASSFLAQQEMPSCNMQQQLSRSPSSPNVDGDFSYSSRDTPFLETNMENNIDKNESSTNFEAEGTTKESVEDSKALVLVPALDAEVLSVVPLSEKPTKRYEFSQRRIRRPFSVPEVEALVEAVETLGAGRWRDVKIRAFDDANHRTYVDLKDKWKTLVHTASISPQQRRGEPVPQDLLDRVLAAHAYWSQDQHAKKHQKTSEVKM